MTSFRISIPPHRRAAASYVVKVRRKLQHAFASKPMLTQTSIAAKLGVNRSVINRQLRGTQDMTLGRVAELAWAMGFEADFELLEEIGGAGMNLPPVLPSTTFTTPVKSTFTTQVKSTNDPVVLAATSANAAGRQVELVG